MTILFLKKIDDISFVICCLAYKNQYDEKTCHQHTCQVLRKSKSETAHAPFILHIIWSSKAQKNLEHKSEETDFFLSLNRQINY